MEQTCEANLGWGRAETGKKKKKEESLFHNYLWIFQLFSVAPARLQIPLSITKSVMTTSTYIQIPDPALSRDADYTYRRIAIGKWDLALLRLVVI